MKQWVGILIGSAVLIAVGSSVVAGAEKKAGKDVEKRVFELRIYTPAAGKLDALHARFRDHTTKLFVKHGMTNVGYWVGVDPKDKQEKLYYLLAYPSKAAADASWKAFRDDPDWKTAKEASEKDGTLVTHVDSIFLTPTDYSAIE